MLVRTYWPDCDYRDGEWRKDRIHSYWVEATAEEAQETIFPYLSTNQQRESILYAKESERITDSIAMGVPRPYCFLVASDLSSIDPFPAHYPFGNLWNGYSPFREIAAHHITDLNGLTALNREDGSANGN